MQVNKFFLSLFTCAALCACSNDELGNMADEPQKFTGDEAYISVRLSDAGSLTRATGGDYEYGTTDEQAVQNAYFYFYDANEVFVAEGSAWNDGTASTGETAGNIEFTSNTVVVLKGLTEKNLPKYMVTVLNRPSNFAAPSTLDAMEEVLSGGIQTTSGNKNYFVMSTTSFAGQQLAKYFVTEVQESNFSLEPINDTDNNENYVTVYVERLAAKVTLDVGSSLQPATIEGKTGKYYVVKATVAGEDNDDDVNESGNQNQIAAEDLYVELLGWKLNATAKDSRMVKNINENWNNTAEGSLGFVWNNSTDHRSFWGMSYNYGKTDGNYPTSYSGATNCKYLNYVNLKDETGNALVKLGKDAYCAENTNTSALVTANFPSAVTSVLLKARICDSEGTPLDLVRFNGVLYKKATFIDYILNVMKAKNKWNVWVETTPAQDEKPAQYAQLDESYVELANVGDGEVKIQLNDKAKNATLYSKSVNGEETTMTPITSLDSINTDLATETADAIGYTGGEMYYNIPIEHLNNSTIDTDGTIPEAKYGVVRNHHYEVTINKLENIGKGIFDPDEVIVPGKDDDSGNTYYVGATINILSWKLINQNVDL